ncbi:hypothetical protein [Nocardioides stalactiti]|uniref:hypothetical protein n=1 Tax=Nocardioides stalactiti TaxID=2755356 RepID=UPI0016035F03|nr:hypothetical protein [Nocardioides stalactiti]
MTAFWIALVVAAVAVAGYTALVSQKVVSAAWPDEAPLQVRENRARDQQVNHLERLLTADDPTAAHQVVREVTQHLLAMPVLADASLDARTAAFVIDDPPSGADRYRRDLAEAVRRIEEL